MNKLNQEINIRELINLYESGKSIRDIAKLDSIPTSIVRKILQENQVKLRDRKEALRMKIAGIKKENKLSNMEIKQIASFYKTGKSIHDLAKSFPVSSNTILRYLKLENVEIRDRVKAVKMKRKLLNCNQEKEIVSLYLSGKSVAELASKFKVSESTIRYSLHKNFIPLRKLTQFQRKYQINEFFFDEINSKVQAYFLGLLYADGCNYMKRNQIRISLKEQDNSILEIFRKYLNSDYPISFVKIKGRKYCVLSFSSKHLSYKLNQLGCVPRKSLRLKFPNWLDKRLFSHFIRGYFDGDGSLSLSKYRNKTGRKGRGICSNFSICSTYEFCFVLKEIFFSKLNIESTIRQSKKAKQRKSNTFNVYSNGVMNAIVIMNWLYEDKSDLFIKRKVVKFSQLKKFLIENPTFTETAKKRFSDKLKRLKEREDKDVVES